MFKHVLYTIPFAIAYCAYGTAHDFRPLNVVKTTDYINIIFLLTLIRAGRLYWLIVFYNQYNRLIDFYNQYNRLIGFFQNKILID